MLLRLVSYTAPPHLALICYPQEAQADAQI